jgi:hypothetical protein
MGNQLAAPARVQPGELLAADVPSLVYKESLGGAPMVQGAGCRVTGDGCVEF